MSNDDILRQRVRQLVHAGKLPARRPDRVWGGLSFEETQCTLCGVRARADELLLEVEVKNGDGDGSTYPRLHPGCFSVLVNELQRLDAAPLGDAA